MVEISLFLILRNDLFFPAKPSLIEIAFSSQAEKSEERVAGDGTEIDDLPGAPHGKAF